MTTTLTQDRHDPTRKPACDIERAFGEHNDDGVHVCTDGPGHFVLGRPHACSCGYSWPAHGQAPADSASERIVRWRSLADLDSRAGAPVGNALRDACDKLERVCELHSPFPIYDECGHRHTEVGNGVQNVTHVGLVCEDGYLYTACRHCCCDALGDQTEACASEHDHSREICPTRTALDGSTT